MRKKIISAVGAHPDDIDVTSSGTIAKWAKEGAEIYYLVCTDGSRGSDDPEMTHQKLAKIRKEEQEKAAKVLGVKKVFFLDHTDTQLKADIDLKREIVEKIRTIRPNIVITMDYALYYFDEPFLVPNRINHTDHREATIATIDAVFPLSRDRLTFPEHEQQGLKPHKVEELFLSSRAKEDFLVDISDTLDTKIKALSMHKSQFEDFEKIKEMVTKRAEFWGKIKGCKFAENFVKIRLT